MLQFSAWTDEEREHFHFASINCVWTHKLGFIE